MSETPPTCYQSETFSAWRYLQGRNLSYHQRASPTTARVTYYRSRHLGVRILLFSLSSAELTVFAAVFAPPSTRSPSLDVSSTTNPRHLPPTWVAGGLGLCGLDLSVGLGPSPPSVHIALCLLCFLVSFSSSRQSTSFVSNIM
jgi:hypothetical protein